ncbi:DUF2516 family protein [Blastococcus tunisiensis]|uniref:DUF2516 domain-containing protein n=1 Tax=Blastococcus tunisiensis TaxID=1798228 RepID=A0A1I2K0E0_9ACTN|nr:DUF2516 family protein [Blastococcus sp. DSM 46838]SFF59758.1 Protein of unknown function [Blastococcus sp. DSM 46838]
MGLFDFWVYTALYWGALALSLWAFVDSLVRPAPAFVATGKLSKPGWVAITGLSAVVIFWLTPMSLLGLPAVIAAIVYLVDVRPAVRGLPRGNSW